MVKNSDKKPEGLFGGMQRNYQGTMAKIVMLVAVALSSYSILAISGFFLRLNIVIHEYSHRSIFLGCILVLVFLLLPMKKKRYEVLEALEEKMEDRFIQQVETLSQWADALPKDKKGMKLIANMIKIITDFLSRQDITFDRFYHMAERDDNEFIRDRVFELLPKDWVKVESDGKGGPLHLMKRG